MRKKIVRYFKCWNYWRKHSLNSTLFKVLVLIGWAKSPTFTLYRILDYVPEKEGTL